MKTRRLDKSLEGLALSNNTSKSALAKKPAAKKVALKKKSAPKKKAVQNKKAAAKKAPRPAIPQLTFENVSTNPPFPSSSATATFETAMDFLSNASGTFLTHGGEFTSTRYMSGIREVIDFDMTKDTPRYYNDDRPGDLNDPYRPGRKVTDEELNSIVYPVPVIQFKSGLRHSKQADDRCDDTPGFKIGTRAIRIANPAGFTLNDILRAIGMYEEGTRNGTTWGDGVDALHNGYDGIYLDKEESVWNISWGS
ncbi:hypothetical protein TrLO_g2427 [Triparma laevis f. longispina]|uniref:Uncharacterized protein n=1 Tax=Triparma laevis f. longispina TaxID=1714387 RepID=A0A9W7FLU2_9STRA|nr:hypothetical protein TrLO_g2427 [Triparma laevis f. longispina]